MPSPIHRVTPLAILVIVALSTTTLAQPTAHVRTAKVLKEKVQEHQRVTGTLRALSRGNVAGLEDGRVTEVTVREGAHVKKGDVLARIDDRRLEAMLHESEAMYATTEALITQREAEEMKANQDVGRARLLFEKKAFSPEELDHATAEYKIAEAQLNAAKRQLHQIKSQQELLRIRLDDTVIRAPFDGRIVERHTEPGEWLRAGDPIVTLVSTGKIDAWLEVPERYSESLSRDVNDVFVSIAATGERVPAIQTKRIPQVHPRTRTFSFVVELDDQEGELTTGMSVTAWIPTGTKAPRLTIPRSAIIRSDRRAYVFKAAPDGESGHTAVQTPVTVLFESGDRAAIESGNLQEGDFVIVEGNERIIPGSRVEFTYQPGQEPQLATLKDR
ncbi:Multidrug resistance protein MdtN [Planctomycetes bacterium Pan216]|uniref:Multidrug resistance protein MdtN n=1 Tax=Kolteria novifilia TaxID=2527975 RepID=A0A518BCG5_9BACT|nr:Multidrug resistance protein MdtN [Planctomycetes bacterium Pan216]